MKHFLIRVTNHDGMPDSYTSAVHTDLETARRAFHEVVNTGTEYGYDKVYLERHAGEKVTYEPETIEILDWREVEYPGFELSVSFEVSR